MLNSPLHVPDHTGGLEPIAFQAQLRRLESLQTLMTQGGTVVGEVAQFLAKAREELSAFQREQEACAGVQLRLVEENRELASKLAEMGQIVEKVSLNAKEHELRVNFLTVQLAAKADGVSREELEAERNRSAARRALAEEKIARLEVALQRECGKRELAVGQVRQDRASLHGAEIALLKDRLSALEHQLEAERERRARLMEVVKIHDVTVTPERQRQPV